jgi:hypothetical protein
MTVKEIAANIGRTGVLAADGGLNIEVEILDANVVYGHLRYKVTPVAGSGVAVVDAGRVFIKS